MGVDYHDFPQGDARAKTRFLLRQEWEIAPNDIVVLYIGRLTFIDKAHPVPMYIALEKAAQLSKIKIHLVQAGGIQNHREEISFVEIAKIFAPSINTITIPTPPREKLLEIWSIGDIFISLSDNIQESFGLTPIEAMAAGLPVIVSDWNGYKESIRDGIDGFRIPTTIPPVEAGLELALKYVPERASFANYSALSAMGCAVDIEQCARALITLISDRELRQKMGESGRKRVQQVYDWQVVIPIYEQLWQDLAEIRATQEIFAPVSSGKAPYPLGDDPFRIFSHYATQTLTDNVILELVTTLASVKLNELQQIWITEFGSDHRIPVYRLQEIIQAIALSGSLSVGEILQSYGHNPGEIKCLQRSLVYLLKFNILRIKSN